jgi:hypothetical protein
VLLVAELHPPGRRPRSRLFPYITGEAIPPLARTRATAATNVLRAHLLRVIERVSEPAIGDARQPSAERLVKAVGFISQ